MTAQRNINDHKTNQSDIDSELRELLTEEIKLVELEREFNQKFIKKIIIAVVLVVVMTILIILATIGLSVYANDYVNSEPKNVIIE